MVRRGEGGFFEFRLEMKNNVLPFFLAFLGLFTTLQPGVGGRGEEDKSRLLPRQIKCGPFPFLYN